MFLRRLFKESVYMEFQVVSTSDLYIYILSLLMFLSFINSFSQDIAV